MLLNTLDGVATVSGLVIIMTTNHPDRLDAALISTKDEFTHPTPKMVPHYARLVAMFSPKGGTVLDPFAGSGTTGVAAVQSGRRFIGIELAREHFDTACERIERAQAQGTLLAEASEPVQAGLL